MSRESDALFSDARLAVLYDLFEGQRDDLDAYVAIVAELGAERVLDIGCGTGEFALRLAARGITVVGLDPAVASIDVARTKPHADEVRWIEGDVSALSELDVDLVSMTGNVAQVFVDDDDWTAALDASARALRSGGHLVFETRIPAQRAWEGWTPDLTRQQAQGPDGSTIQTWQEVTEVALPLISFVTSFLFSDGRTATSTSTLRFRSAEEVEADLLAAGFGEIDIRDAADRPGREFVFVARRR